MNPQLSLKSVSRAWDEFFFAPKDAYPYSFFRILYASLLLFNNVVLFPNLEKYYGENGLVSLALAQSLLGPKTWMIFSFLPATSATLWTVYWIFNVAALALFFGAFSRVAAIVCYICLMSFQHRNDLLIDGSDSVFRIFGMLLIFMPLGKMLSVDRTLKIFRGDPSAENRTGAPAALRMVQVYLCFMYLVSCYYKLQGDEWVMGHSMYYVSRLDDTFGRNWFPKFVFEYMPITQVLTWSVLWLEGAVPFLLWFKETRKPALLVTMGFHLACEYSMNLYLFHWVMILGWLCFFKAEELRAAMAFVVRLVGKIGVSSVTLKFDPKSETYRRLAIAIEEWDVFSLVSVEQTRQGNVFEVTTKRGSYSGVRAARAAMTRMPLAWPFFPVLFLPTIERRWFPTSPRTKQERKAS